MVSSRGTLVNKLLTLNEIFLNLLEILSVFSLVIKSVVFDMVCLDFPSGVNDSARYIAISYTAVPILKMIGIKVILSTASLSLNMQTLVVP